MDGQGGADPGGGEESEGVLGGRVEAEAGLPSRSVEELRSVRSRGCWRTLCWRSQLNLT